MFVQTYALQSKAGHLHTICTMHTLCDEPLNICHMLSGTWDKLPCEAKQEQQVKVSINNQSSQLLEEGALATIIQSNHLSQRGHAPGHNIISSNSTYIQQQMTSHCLSKKVFISAENIVQNSGDLLLHW